MAALDAADSEEAMLSSIMDGRSAVWRLVPKAPTDTGDIAVVGLAVEPSNFARLISFVYDRASHMHVHSPPSEPTSELQVLLMIADPMDRIEDERDDRRKPKPSVILARAGRAGSDMDNAGAL